MSREEHIREVQTFVVLECFHDLANLQLTRETHGQLEFYLTLPLLHPHYINPYYSCNWKKSFREKTLEIYLRVRDFHPSILYTFLLVFFTLFPLNFNILWKELISNTINTQSKCRELFWCNFEALSSYQFLVGATGRNCRNWKANEDKT